jgi:hypothetical protein
MSKHLRLRRRWRRARSVAEPSVSRAVGARHLMLTSSRLVAHVPTGRMTGVALIRSYSTRSSWMTRRAHRDRPNRRHPAPSSSDPGPDLLGAFAGLLNEGQRANHRNQVMTSRLIISDFRVGRRL